MKKLLTLLALILLVIPLSADTLRVGIYNLPTFLSDDFKDSFDSFFNTLNDLTLLQEIKDERDYKAYKINNDKEIHKALVDEKEIKQAKSFEKKSITSVEYITLEDPSLDQFFTLHDLDMLEYVKARSNLDLIIFFESEVINNVSFLESFVYDSNIKGLISLAYINKYDLNFYNEFQNAIARIYFPSSAFISSTIPISIDSVNLFNSKQFAIDVKYKEYLYKDELFPLSLSPLETYYIESEESDIEYFAKVFTTPNDAEISLYGLPYGSNQISLSVKDESVILSLNRDGFLPKSVQLDKIDGVYSLSLKPEWMGKDGLVKDEKNNFYRALRDSILSFALLAISESIANIYTQEVRPYSTILNSCSYGLCIFNLVNLIKAGSTYYNTAKEIYL